MVELDRHPLADRDEVEFSVTVEVDPGGVRDHSARMREVRCDLLGDVGEVITIVAEQVAPCGSGIAQRFQATADEEVESPVAGEVPRSHRRRAGQHRWKGIRRRAREPAAAQVHVQPTLKKRRDG